MSSPTIAFQSAPEVEVGGDRAWPVTPWRSHRFNQPPRLRSGETQADLRADPPIKRFNQPPRLRSGETRLRLRRRRLRRRFQSAPEVEVGGDNCTGSGITSGPSFNQPPRLRSGETTAGACHPSRPKVSISPRG